MLDRLAYGRELDPLLREAAAYAYARLGNRPDAEDAVQQAALQAWNRIGQYETTRPFKGWWFAILRNCCFDILRQRVASRTEELTGVDPPDTRTTEATVRLPPVTTPLRSWAALTALTIGLIVLRMSPKWSESLTVGLALHASALVLLLAGLMGMARAGDAEHDARA